MSKKHFEDENRLTESTFRRKFGNDETIGFCSTLCSSAFYTVSLFMLRQLTDYQDICSSDWSLAVKELTTVVCVLPLILIQCIRGKYRFPDWKTLLIVFTAGVMCQVVGARPHLMAYAAIGIALTTPLIQAIQMTGTSVIGAVYLKEKVSKTKAVTILLLIAAICLLSLSGLGDSVGKIAGQPMRIWFGLLCVISTGIGYSSQLLLMRTVLRKSRENNGASHVPTSLMMVSTTGIGFLVCVFCLTLERGGSAFFAPPPFCWMYALIAGIANMCGFFCQIEGLRRLYVSKSSVIAASQTLTLAVVGILFFNEPFNFSVAFGLILVAVGVVLAGFSK